jgi:membrane protease subunit HflC
MMGLATRIVLGGLLLLGILVAGSSFYIIPEGEQVIITQFGKPVSVAQPEAGLYFKAPWQDVNRFEKRMLRWDGQREEIPTKDKKFIWVDTTARWRITDPRKFLESVRGSYNTALSRLDDLIDGAVRDAVSSHLLIEMVRSNKEPGQRPDKVRGEETSQDESTSELYTTLETGREEIQKDILLAARSSIQDQYGIELVDVLVKRINYIDDVANTVFERMIAERGKIAKKYRSEGEGRAAEINGERERKLLTITSEAYRKAQEIEGTADAEATRIYAEAYSADPEFYSFWRSLELLPNVIGKNTRLVLGTDSELFKYLKGSKKAQR